MHPSQNPAHNFYEKALYKTENNSFPIAVFDTPRTWSMINQKAMNQEPGRAATM
jgi:hypothetical protein